MDFLTTPMLTTHDGRAFITIRLIVCNSNSEKILYYNTVLANIAIVETSGK